MSSTSALPAELQQRWFTVHRDNRQSLLNVADNFMVFKMVLNGLGIIGEEKALHEWVSSAPSAGLLDDPAPANESIYIGHGGNDVTLSAEPPVYLHGDLRKLWPKDGPDAVWKREGVVQCHQELGYRVYGDFAVELAQRKSLRCILSTIIDHLKVCKCICVFYACG